jgi:hypothetical protein
MVIISLPLDVREQKVTAITSLLARTHRSALAVTVWHAAVTATFFRWPNEKTWPVAT